MIALQLLSTPQGPVTDEPERRFADESITIGRAPNCQLVLPDGLRIISRQHARLTVQRGEVLLTCLSASAPVRVNDSAVPHGGVHALRGGDLIHIGGFALRMNELAPTAPASLATPPAMPPPVPEPGLLPSVTARPGGRGRGRLDEWFDLEPASPAAVPPAGGTPAGEGVPGGGAAASVDLDLRSGVYAAGAQAADLSVFESLQQVPAARPAPAHPAATESPPGMEVDVPISLGIVARGPAAEHPVTPLPDDPHAVADGAAPKPVDIDMPAEPGTVVLSNPSVLPVAGSGLFPSREMPRGTRADPLPLPDTGSGTAPDARLDAPPVPDSPPVLAALNDDDRMALVQAFLEGAGLAPRMGATSTQVLAPITLTPPWMRHVGELLRASVEGVLALLHSRSTVKREMRAEVTVIARRQNNPLKFAPDTVAALAHLLAAKRSPGFLEPVAAVKDAHEDLLVHHLAVVAGMRAAMFELIARLGPDDVIRDEGPAKGLAATMPSLHEAALWRRYRQRHAEMTARLDDDFETVFGREFTKAYEAQARRVREQAPPEGTSS